MAVITVGELKKELRNWPDSYEVMLEVNGYERLAQGISIETGGVSTWLIISDFPDTKD